MHRLPDWDARLAAYLEPLRLRPFGPYGTHDCCTFSAGAVIAMTGVDPIPEFRGRYRTPIGYMRALKRHGAGTLPATLDTKFARIGAPFAQRGDLVMSAGFLGIAYGSFAIFVGQEGEREGLVRIDRADWVDPLAWRVAYG